MPAAVACSTTLDADHAGALKDLLAVIQAVGGQPSALGDRRTGRLGPQPAVLGALLAAELEQHNHESEVTQQAPARSFACEVLGHRDGDGGPRALVDLQVQQADGRAAGGVVDALAPDHPCAHERVKQDLDGAPAGPAAACERLVAEVHDAVLAGVALLVGELALQCVEPDRAHQARAACRLADRADRGEVDLEERQLATVPHLNRLLM